MPSLTIPQAFDLAIQLHSTGRLPEAESAYRQILQHQPNHAGSVHGLGVLAIQVGRLEAGVELLRQAISLQPDFAAVYSNLGKALDELGRSDEAIAAHQRSIALEANSPDTLYNLGIALAKAGKTAQAIAAFQRAIALRPEFPAAYNDLGTAQVAESQLDSAIASYQQAVALRPGFPEAHNNLGNALKENGRAPESIAVYEQAISLKPDFAEAYSNLGNALQQTGRVGESITAYETAMRMKPDSADVHTNLAIALLLYGQFRRGWEEYEWRYKRTDIAAPPEKFSQRQWDGSDLTGRTILLRTEQGLGDTIQFIRYAPLLSGNGAKVIVRGEPLLKRLLQRASGVDLWLTPDDPLPPFDVHLPLLSLPRLFKTTLESIPATVPYLFAESDLTAKWQNRLMAKPRALNVGIVWAGNPNRLNDRSRSIKLADLAPILHVPGARFISLQKGEPAAQAGNLPAGTDLIDWTAELPDFADTAALIANLDLVISVDTAVAHLAGAMAKPVWVMLPFAPDWRWMLDRDDSPWYPTMRLFRQTAPGDWATVAARVADALREFAAVA